MMTQRQDGLELPALRIVAYALYIKHQWDYCLHHSDGPKVAPSRNRR